MGYLFIIVRHPDGVDHFRMMSRSNNEVEVETYVRRIVEMRLGIRLPKRGKPSDVTIEIKPDLPCYILT